MKQVHIWQYTNDMNIFSLIKVKSCSLWSESCSSFTENEKILTSRFYRIFTQRNSDSSLAWAKTDCFCQFFRLRNMSILASVINIYFFKSGMPHATDIIPLLWAFFLCVKCIFQNNSHGPRPPTCMACALCMSVWYFPHIMHVICIWYT